MERAFFDVRSVAFGVLNGSKSTTYKEEENKDIDDYALSFWISGHCCLLYQVTQVCIVIKRDLCPIILTLRRVGGMIVPDKLNFCT